MRSTVRSLKRLQELQIVCSYHPPVQFSLAKQILQAAVELCHDTSEVLIPTMLFSYPLLRGEKPKTFKGYHSFKYNNKLYA